jgi:hypothetical protein
MRIEIIQMAYLDRQTMAANEATTQKKRGQKTKTREMYFGRIFMPWKSKFAIKKVESVRSGYIFLDLLRMIHIALPF